MKQLCMMNDTVMHPKATPRILYVVASMPKACSKSGGGVSTGRYGEARTPAFAKYDRVGRCPSLITSERPEAILQKMTHNK
jgi:hypothetical protein